MDPSSEEKGGLLARMSARSRAEAVDGCVRWMRALRCVEASVGKSGARSIAWASIMGSSESIYGFVMVVPQSARIVACKEALCLW